MDLLKEELLKKRQKLAQETGGKRYFKRSEIEQREIQKLREQEKRELEAKSRRQSTTSSSTANATSDNSNLAASSTASATATSTAGSSKSLTDEQNIDNLDLPRQEVIRRLRFLKQPITLFGEDDAARLDRLLNEWNQELDEMSEAEKRTAKGKGMVATFKQCARYLNPLFKFCRKKHIYCAALSLFSWYLQVGILVIEVVLLSECLLTFMRVLPDDIRQALLLMVECCMMRDYLAAMDHYIKLAIGNAPWPIGVTMVGIHERSAREKIYTNSVAHIMNDETTRKYLQSVKRLMTFCQRRYPTLPSKAVEFNSLANGSDLQSLLAQENSGGSSSEEMLRLMPPKES
ncbi:hypothetical protein COLO4_09079 [Corchorus olitorius]|uniref:Pre-mRNA-splicing factor 18 n=1 Tax=Corchorus olitorius TaxID=93759 RepID=A0A1R3KD85_9ROSI|nr:hypothetical protein COLO4_09079 [Corchorus olitorius]